MDIRRGGFLWFSATGMNPRLFASKRRDLNAIQVDLAVVDMDKSPDYPENFLCRLPVLKRLPRRLNDSSNIFLRIFGNRSIEVAKTLLTDALQEEDDVEIKAEIKRRLKLLENGRKI